MTSTNRTVRGNFALAAATAGLMAASEVAEAAPGYQIMRQLTNITTGTIESVKVRMSDGDHIAFVSNGDVMGPGTQTATRQIYLWKEQPNGTGVITRVTNLPGCESYEVSRPTDTVLSDRPEIIAFVSTCNFDPGVGNADGNPEIFFWEIVSGAFHQITNTVAPVVNGEPFPSDSGRCLVFRSNGNIDNNQPSHPHYDDTHPGPGYSNPDGSDEVFLYGKLDDALDYPYTAVFTQVSNGPAGTHSSHPVINGYYFPRQCQTTAFQSDYDQTGGQGPTGQGIYIYKMPMSAIEPITAAEIPMGFPDGIYRNPMISGASPFARGPHIVFEAEPDLWRNTSGGTNIFDWRDFHPRMTQYTDLGTGFVASEPQVGDGGGIISFSSTGEVLHPGHEAKTGEIPPFNPDGNHEIFIVEGRRSATQITDTTGCQNMHTSISDDGGRIAFISNCDLLGHDPAAQTQVYMRQLERDDYPLLVPGACEEADGCCIFSRKITTCAYHPLKGRKLKIERPNCLDKPQGCDN